MLTARWIWVAWERHRRSRELARDLAVPLYDHDVRLPRVLRHPYLAARTLCLLVRERPDGVVVQSPSFVLALLVSLARTLFGFALVVDAHNEGVRPFSARLAWLAPLYAFVHRRANRVVVTNEALASIVAGDGGRPVVLEDKLPALGEPPLVALRGRRNVVVVSTFAKDEPIEEILAAAPLLDGDTVLHVTGNPRRLDPARAAALPRNVVLTGFLPEEDYVALIRSAELVVDLTRLDDCLVCGAYEAVALGRPMVLTDNPSSRRYFRKGAVFTANEPRAIAEAITTALAERERLESDVADLRRELTTDWMGRRAALVASLNAITDGGDGRIARPVRV